MEIKLKYPVFEFVPNNNMVYVFYDDNQNKTTNTELFSKLKFKDNVFVDSSGMKYIVKRAYITRYWGFWEGLFRMKGKVVSFEYEYKDEGTSITLDELKTMIMSKYPKSRWFGSAWSDVEEFKKEMDRCTTFEQVALIVGGTPPSKFRNA